MTLDEILKKANESFDVTPFQINNGFCYDWAEIVYNLCEKHNIPVEFWETPFDVAEASHAFVRVGGKFIDSECLTGVADHMLLPLFTNFKHRQPIWLLDHNMEHRDGPTYFDMTESQIPQQGNRSAYST